MQQPPTAALAVGDAAPRLALAEAGGGEVDLAEDAFAGRPQVWLLHDPAQAGAAADCAGKVRDMLADRLPRLLCVTICRGDLPAGRTRDSGEAPAWRRPILHLQGRAAMLPAAGAGLYGVAVGPNGHIRGIHPGTTDSKAQIPELAAALVASLVGLAPAAQTRPGEMHPPVLIVPDILNAADCRRLITVYGMRGQKFVEPGHNVAGQTTDYKMRIPDYGREDRVDHWVIDQDTNGLIDSRLQPRLLPEIQKAFQYRVSRRETYRIACYNGARGGRPIPHRDNTQANVAHRRFAVTINLNSEAFEGGSLRFPEFSDHRYRPESGAAIVFSCSLLHEVMAVESGTRFALLAFVYGDA